MLQAARTPVLPLIWANIFCCCKGTGTPEFSSCSRTGVFEGHCLGAAPKEMTAEGSRQTSGTSWQPSTYVDKTSSLEILYYSLAERMVQVENETSMKKAWCDSVDARLQFLESFHRQHAASDHYKAQETSNTDPPSRSSYQEAFPGGVTQKEVQEKEEHKKLKEKVKELEARNKELLSKAMSMHKHSEDMNDPSRLSAVLQMYEMLRLRDWEKLRCSTVSCWSYKSGSSIIKKLFDACEKDIQQRTANIFEILDIPPSNDAMTNIKQGMVEEIRNLLRYSYYHNHSEFYSKIIMEPPVEAEWNLQENLQYLEHVDKKGLEHWRKPAFLWPVMKCGESVLVKGVVWD
ncbi:uncharacterized protein [Nyctibius grandis]|uniref:uncharacterized protein isoform X2 n=1 Tax=Nyctibius grandis TaxID=48427 RepID=UPI0035BBC6BD